MRILVFDLETQDLISKDFSRTRLSVGVTYDVEQHQYESFSEETIGQLIQNVLGADLVIGFNVLAFDYRLLKNYSPNFDFNRIHTLDLLLEVRKSLGYMVGLNRISQATFQSKKLGNGYDAIRWYKAGQWKRLVAYCQRDVELTYRIWEHGQQKGYICVPTKEENVVQKVPVQW